MNLHKLPSRVQSCYRDATLADRAHVRVRWSTCPWDRLLPLIPESGHILDFGCGHGLASFLLAEGSPDRRLVGTDIDVDKLDVARRAAHRFGCHAPVFPPGCTWSWSDETWDAILVTDVLYLLPAREREELLGALAATLAPGGVLVIKEVDQRPRWKYRLARLQERAATRSGVTAGSSVDFMDPDELTDSLEAAGLAVTRVPMDSGYPHPHLALVASAAEQPVLTTRCAG